MEEKRPPGAFLFQEYEKHFAMLERSEQGDLVMAMFYYMRTGEVPEGLPPVVRMAFGFIRDDMDRDTEKYRKKCERNANNGRKGGRPKNPEKPNGFDENPEKPKKANYNYNPKFIPSEIIAGIIGSLITFGLLLAIGTVGQKNKKPPTKE